MSGHTLQPSGQVLFAHKNLGVGSGPKPVAAKPSSMNFATENLDRDFRSKRISSLLKGHETW